MMEQREKFSALDKEKIAGADPLPFVLIIWVVIKARLSGRVPLGLLGKRSSVDSHQAWLSHD